MTLRVAVVTGARSEYGLLRPVMAAIDAEPGMELHLVATGTHLKAGGLDRIRGDGFPVAATFPCLAEDDTLAAMTRSLGRGITAATDAFETVAPNVVVVLGDRYETFAAAVSASYSGRIVAHIHGGDVSGGGYDEYTRHALTKIAHVHFPATAASARRIRQMGEDPSHVHMVGSPALDDLLEGATVSSGPPARLGLRRPYVLFVMHPVSTDPAAATTEWTTALEATLAEAEEVVVVGPNMDPGGRALSREASTRSGIRFFPDLPRSDYLRLLANAEAIVGNSSSGIIEAAALGRPAVDVGARQEGREAGGNVLRVPMEADAVRAAVRRALDDRAFRDAAATAPHPFGDGKAAGRIAAVLRNLPPREAIVKKRLHDFATR